jgi:hypothetical protein
MTLIQTIQERLAKICDAECLHFSSVRDDTELATTAELRSHFNGLQEGAARSAAAIRAADLSDLEPKVKKTDELVEQLRLPVQMLDRDSIDKERIRAADTIAALTERLKFFETHGYEFEQKRAEVAERELAALTARLEAAQEAHSLKRHE